MAKKDKDNNGVINNGPGNVVVTDTVLGTSRSGSPTGTNNGVVNTGGGNVVISGSVMGDQSRR